MSTVALQRDVWYVPSGQLAVHERQTRFEDAVQGAASYDPSAHAEHHAHTRLLDDVHGAVAYCSVAHDVTQLVQTRLRPNAHGVVSNVPDRQGPRQSEQAADAVAEQGADTYVPLPHGLLGQGTHTRSVVLVQRTTSYELGAHGVHAEHARSLLAVQNALAYVPVAHAVVVQAAQVAALDRVHGAFWYEPAGQEVLLHSTHRASLVGVHGAA